MRQSRRTFAKFRRVVSLVSTFACCVALSACISSENPMFATADAVQPLKAGKYAAFEQDNGAFVEAEPVELRLRDDKTYDFVDEKGDVTPVSIHRLDGSRFIAQAQSAAGDGFNSYSYAVIELIGDEVLVYAPDCAQQDGQRMDELGVEVGRYECRIDRVADPRGLFARFDLGAANSKFVRK